MNRPVLIGVGGAREPAEAIDLMVLAAERAVGDSGARSDTNVPLDAVIVPQGSWPYRDPGREIARRLGSPQARSVLGDLGVSQQGLISAAMEMIMRGDAAIVLVVGGESRRWSTDGGYVDLDGVPDLRLERPHDFVDQLEIDAGIAFPAVRSYALLQRAFDHRIGRGDAPSSEAVSTLWASMSRVAAAAGTQAFEAPRDSDFLATPSPENRLMAAPYMKWHCSQWNLDDASALLLCSEEAARELRLDPSAALHPLVALESTHSLPVIRREELGRWPAMEVLGRRSSEHLGVSLRDIELIDLYSCFPVAVMLQAHELGLALDPVPTLTGGMTFAGGPFNNYVLDSHVAMARALRSRPGARGLVTSVSGLLTKPGLGIWSTEPSSNGVLLADLDAEAEAATSAVACGAFEPGGNLTIESSTAFLEGEAPRSIVIGRDGSGRRSLAVLDDDASFDRFSARSCIGEDLR